MITREFEQSTKYFDGDYYNPSQNIFKDLGIFCEELYNQLKFIDENQSNEFNAISPISISNLIKIFNKNYDDIIDFGFKKEQYIKEQDCFDQKLWQNHGRFGIITFKKFAKDNIYTKQKGILKIESPSYEILKKYVDKIFEIEDIGAKPISIIWNNTLKLNGKGKFNLLVKVIDDWRNEIWTDEKIRFMDNRIATSMSYINNNKSAFFHEDSTKHFGCVGIIYEVGDDAIICAKNSDAFLEEYIDKKSPLSEQLEYTSGILKVKTIGNHDIYSTATRIGSPQGVIEKYSYGFNELVVDSTKAKPVAIFYVNKSENFSTFSDKALVRAKLLSKLYNLPLRKLSSFNKYLQDNATKKI